MGVIFSDSLGTNEISVFFSAMFSNYDKTLGVPAPCLEPIPLLCLRLRVCGSMQESFQQFQN